jgi:hypothetical protein
VDRATPDVKAVLEDRKPSPITNGYIRAVITHSERQQREANQEAENQRNGNYAPVFSQADEQKIDIGFYEARKPPSTTRPPTPPLPKAPRPVRMNSELRLITFVSWPQSRL